MVEECVEYVNYNFSVWDWVVFGALFLISALIGAYFGYVDRDKGDDTEEYILGGRGMHGIPVSLSLTASFMSAITVLGTPAEFYLYGTMFWYFGVAYTIVAFVTSELYIPLFYRLGITSTYEYLELRFNFATRITATCMYMLNTILYIGIVIYAPALALNEVSNLGIWWSVILTGVVCTFYTALGGLKAVIWTDVFQCVVMWIGFVAVIIVGCDVMGGFENVWDIAIDGGRVIFDNFDIDYRERYSFWTIIIGGTIVWTGTYSTSQTMVQRYQSCKSENQAKLSVWVNLIGLYIILVLTGLSGIVMYAYYSSCDPYTAGYVSATDQLMPYFVLEVLHDYPGLPGIYVCSAFSGSLSTVSSGINGLATVTLQDFIVPFKEISPRTSVIVTKILVVVYGTICILMAWVASNLGGVLELALSITGIINGPLLALFTLGALCPWINSIGAIVGVITGLICSTWVYIGSTNYPTPSAYSALLELTTEECCCHINETATNAFLSTTAEPYRPPIADLYAMSYLYYGVFGFIVCFVVAHIVTFPTGYQRPSEVDPRTIWPMFDHPMFCFIPVKIRHSLWCGVNHEDDVIAMEKLSSSVDFEEIGENKLNKNNVDKGTYESFKMFGMYNETFENDKVHCIVEEESTYF